MSDGFEADYIAAEHGCLHTQFWHGLHKECADGTILDEFDCTKCDHKLKFDSTQLSAYKDAAERVTNFIHAANGIIDIACVWGRKNAGQSLPGAWLEPLSAFETARYEMIKLLSKLPEVMDEVD